MSSPLQQQTSLERYYIGRSHIKTIRFGSSMIQKINQPTIKSASLYIRPRHHGAEVASQPTGCCRFLLGQHPSKKQTEFHKMVPCSFRGICEFGHTLASEFHGVPVVPLSVPTNKTLGL